MKTEYLARIRFGMATLMREPSARDRDRTLDAALDLGIRKFDTAPIYGLGAADKDLSRLIRRSGQSLHVTTKFGRVLSTRARLLAPVQRPLRSLVRRSEHLRGAARSSVNTVRVPPPPGFDALRDRVSRACETFHRDHLDELLTHEIPSTPAWDLFLRHLFGRTREIQARRFGISGSHDLLNSFPEDVQRAASVVQTPIENGPAGGPGQTSVLFGALSAMRSRCDADDAAMIAIYNTTGRRVEGNALYPLLLAVCLSAFPHADVVIGTSSSRHLKSLILDAGTWLEDDNIDLSPLSFIATKGVA